MLRLKKIKNSTDEQRFHFMLKYKYPHLVFDHKIKNTQKDEIYIFTEDIFREYMNWDEYYPEHKNEYIRMFAPIMELTNLSDANSIKNFIDVHNIYWKYVYDCYTNQLKLEEQKLHLEEQKLHLEKQKLHLEEHKLEQENLRIKMEFEFEKYKYDKEFEFIHNSNHFI